MLHLSFPLTPYGIACEVLVEISVNGCGEEKVETGATVALQVREDGGSPEVVELER